MCNVVINRQTLLMYNVLPLFVEALLLVRQLYIMQFSCWQTQETINRNVGTNHRNKHP